ncbi:MAG: hypothetical protein R3335_14840 [Anaerolineales bacterium]|nr:hypothetical protein [Anaerolineales bacterium]
MKTLDRRKEPFDLYRYQLRMLPGLLGWAAGSMAAGLVLLLSNTRFRQGIGLQFLAWGFIDGLIALFGLRGAAANASRFRRGELTEVDLERQTKTFEEILWVNVFLDVGYVIFGRRMMRLAEPGSTRAGTGLGISVQGAFLFLWDLLLIFLMRSSRHGR